ncbi:MAG: Apolipoprotein N-acyltransferase [Labilithrix sp.]|nr:Apolipoprotein N-acyltransferase [Labilithrix sp.]
MASPSTGDLTVAIRRRTRALLAFGSGVVFATSTPPIDFHAGILVGLLGFALALELPAPTPSSTRARWRTGAALGWLFGLGANLVALRFVPEVVMRFTPLPGVAAWTALVLLSAAQALPWAVGGAVAHRLAQASPPWLAYGFGVYVATFVPSVFPWTPSGGLAPWPLLLQTAELVGERGTSFLFAIAAGLVAHALLRFRASRDARTAAAPVAVAVAVVAVMVAWGALRVRAVDRARDAAPHARVALVQPGFDASDRWDASRASMMIDRLSTLTKSAEQRGAELTIWPESAYPFTLPHATRTSPSGARAVLQSGVHGPVLTGAYMSGAKGLGYNSAILASPDGALSAPYDKRHLLWFGETVPLADWFPWLRDVFSKGTGLLAGHESVAFVAGPIRAAVLNCYEDTLPEAGREAMETSPNLLVNVTNDAWFAGSAEGELHLRLAVLRAIETRRDLVRAVNQGPTTFVDATGRVRARYDLPMPGVLQATPALIDGAPTLFTRFGDYPLALLSVIAIGSAALRARRKREQGTGTGTGTGI